MYIVGTAKKQGFLHGAMILAVAGIVVKVIGACFKIPLGAILKPEGMAAFSIAYNIYALLFVLSTAGVPVAVSKMIAEALARSRTFEVWRIYRVSLLAFVTIGSVATVVLFLGADYFAVFMGSSDAADAIRAISPAILFVSIASITRGYYQGNSNMIPTAMSQVIEAMGKLVIGLGLAWWLAHNGFGANMVAAGAVTGVSVGALLSAMYLLLVKRRDEELTCIRSTEPKRRKRELLSELLRLAVPITLGASVISLTNVIDSALVMNLLQKIGYTVRESMWLYGSYNYATTLFNLPSVFITTIGVSLIPAIAGAFIKRDITKLNQTTESAMRIAMLVAMPASLGMFALAQPIVYLLYGGILENTAIAAAGHMLALLSLAVPFLSIVTLTSSIHQSLGNVKLPVVSMLVGAGVKLLSNWVLVSIHGININGACISTILCYAVIAVINMSVLCKMKIIDIHMVAIFFKPTIAGIITGVVASLTYTGVLPYIGIKLGTITAVLIGGIAYLIAIFMLRVLTNDDISLIFGKKRITKIFKNN